MGDTDDNNMVRDSSGHGNKAILIGDYSLRKNAKDSPTTRDSSLDVPSISDKKRAF